MSRLPTLSAVFVLLAAPAMAQSGYQQLFLSPAGEPFRAPLGEIYPAEAWFKAADKNGDGALDLAEFKADAQRFFKSLDSNGDGLLESVEVSVYEVKVAPEIMHAMAEIPSGVPEPRYERGPNGEPAIYVGGGTHIQRGAKDLRNVLAKRRGAGLYTFLDDPQPVRNADTNLDFNIAWAEAEAAAGRRFAVLDTDGDGKLSREELPATPAQMLIARVGKRHFFGR